VVDRAFDAFFRGHVAQTVRLARLITGSQTVGEEIAQEAFSAVYVRWSQLDEPAGYLRTAVVNRSRSHLRRLDVARRGTVRLGAPPVGHEDQYTDADGSLRTALEGLNERQRTAVVLRYWADMSEREIAKALDCRPGTVKSMLSRAMNELRKVIDQ
jgi:RNA polymerase sigma-70 factor (sigma-E family)